MAAPDLTRKYSGEFLAIINQIVKSAQEVCVIEDSCEHAARIRCSVCGRGACREHSRRYNGEDYCKPCGQDVGKEDAFEARYGVVAVLLLLLLSLPARAIDCEIKKSATRVDTGKTVAYIELLCPPAAMYAPLRVQIVASDFSEEVPADWHLIKFDTACKQERDDSPSVCKDGMRLKVGKKTIVARSLDGIALVEGGK